MTTFRPTNSAEIRTDLESARPGDTVILPKGNWKIDRQYKFRGVTVTSEQANPFDCMLFPEGIGEMFTGDGDCEFSNFSFRSIGVGIQLERDNNIARNIGSINCNRAIKVSGNGNKVQGAILIDSSSNAIDVNGGFVYLSTRPDDLLRTKQELGLVNNTAPKNDDYTPEEIAEMEENYYRRDMNCIIEDVVAINSGYFGGNFFGGFIKLVPQAGGVTIRNCVAVGCVNGIWFDDPSATESIIENNYLIGIKDDGIFLEIGTGDKQNFIVRNNFLWNCSTALFVSACNGVNSYGNVYGFSQYGIRANGWNGNRVGRFIEVFTEPGQEPDQLIAMNSLLYSAHYVQHETARYDKPNDVLAYVNPPVFGPYSILTKDARNSPVSDLSGVAQVDKPGIPEGIVFHPWMTEDVLWEIGSSFEDAKVPAAPFHATGDVPTLPDPTPTPTPDPAPDPTPPAPIDLEAMVAQLRIDVDNNVAVLNDHDDRLNALEAGVVVAPSPDPDPTPQPSGDIVIMGNDIWNDEDDLASVPIQALLAVAADYEAETFFFMGNHIRADYTEARKAKIAELAKYVDDLGFDVFDMQADQATSMLALKASFESGQQVTVLEGGRMHYLDDTLKAIDPKHHKNITLVSHSRINEGVLWDRMKRDHPDVTFIELRDGNKFLRSEDWNWMDSSDIPLVIEAREQMRVADDKVNDASDATMSAWYFLGKDQATVQDIRDYFEANL